MTIIWSGNRKPRYALFKRTLPIYLSDIQIIVAPARLFHILPARFRCSFQENERESGETMHERKANIVVWETVEWVELNTVWNIIIFIKQDLPDACFRCHVDDIEILRAFAWLRSNRRNLCLFSQNVRRSVAHNRDNNKQTNNHTFGGLENFLDNPLERQIIRMLQKHKEENEEQMSCQKFVGWR